MRGCLSEKKWWDSKKRDNRADRKSRFEAASGDFRQKKNPGMVSAGGTGFQGLTAHPPESESPVSAEFDPKTPNIEKVDIIYKGGRKEECGGRD